MTNASPTDTIALPASPLTYEAFLAWAGDMMRVEWVAGEVVLKAPYSVQHQLLAGFLSRLISEHVEAHDLGLGLPAFMMYLRQHPSGRELDILFVARDRVGQFRTVDLDGPADLAVEIVSPDSVRRDRADKFLEYEAGGVREYWVLDPMRHEALFYILADDERYRRVDPDPAGIYHSTVLPGFWLQTNWLWQEPHPTMTAIRAQWSK